MQTQARRSRESVRYVAKIGILSAMAAVVMLFQFPLPFLAPPFYQLDFSEVVALIGTFALGPGAGVLIELIKNLLNLLLTGTETGFVGELANFLIGCTYVLPAALFYHGKKKSLRRALIGMACGTLSLAVCGALFNYYILIPFYSTQYALPLEEIVAMGHAIFPVVQDLLTLVLFTVIPFNLVKGVLCSVITGLLYKHVSPLLHK